MVKGQRGGSYTESSQPSEVHVRVPRLTFNFTWEGPMGPLEAYQMLVVTQLSGTDSRGQAVLREGKGQEILELQHRPIGAISLHLHNSLGIELREQKGCSLKLRTMLKSITDCRPSRTKPKTKLPRPAEEIEFGD